MRAAIKNVKRKRASHDEHRKKTRAPQNKNSSAQLTAIISTSRALSALTKDNALRLDKMIIILKRKAISVHQKIGRTENEQETTTGINSLQGTQFNKLRLRAIETQLINIKRIALKPASGSLQQ